MPVDVNDILGACELLAEDDSLNVTLQEPLRCTAVGAAAIYIGGVLLGPVGIPIGAAIGGIAGYSVSRKYKPLWQVIKEMSHEKKERLAVHMRKILDQLGITDAVLLITIVTNPNSQGRVALIKELRNFFS